MHLRACKISKSAGGGPPDPPQQEGETPSRTLPPHTDRWRAALILRLLKIFLQVLFYKLKTLKIASIYILHSLNLVFSWKLIRECILSLFQFHRFKTLINFLP